MAPRYVAGSALALGLGLCLGCSGGAERRARGSWVDQQSPKQQSESPQENFGSWDELERLSTYTELGTVSPSEHLNGRFNARIWTSTAATEATPAVRFAEGAILVEALQPLGSDRVDAYLAMVKRKPGFNPTAGDWEFLVVGADGVIENRGPLPLCSRCHAEAPTDAVFTASKND